MTSENRETRGRPPISESKVAEIYAALDEGFAPTQIAFEQCVAISTVYAYKNMRAKGRADNQKEAAPEV